MLTRFSAEGAAAAAAAVVASAASVASRQREACTAEGVRVGVSLRSTHARARPALVPFLRALKAVPETRDYAVTSMEYAVAFTGVPTGRGGRRRPRQRLPRHPRQMSASAWRNLNPPPIGRTLGPPERLRRSNSFDYLYGGAVVS